MTVVYRRPSKQVEPRLQTKTLGELFQEQMPSANEQGNIWDYKIWSPLSLDDPASITVDIWYGTSKAESKRRFIIELGAIREIK